MKPGNESLLFSWWARLVAMDPKTKIGLWLFGEVGDGFSELYLTLRPGWGLVLKSASCFHHRWAHRGQEICPCCGTPQHLFSCKCSWRLCPRAVWAGGTEARCFPKATQRWGTPCLWEWKMAEKPWGYTWLYHRQSHTSPLTDRAEK